MIAPTLHASVQRRVLVNYRVDPDVLAPLLPLPFRPVTVAGFGVAGICLIRLAAIRPRGVPAFLGTTSENAAYRVAVEWETSGGPARGVFVWRRDTSSALAAFVAGRLFPGAQHHAQFRVEEGAGVYRVELASRDDRNRVTVVAHQADTLMVGSIFDDLPAASIFFREAPLAYTATSRSSRLEGVELSTDGWAMAPLHLDDLHSSFFDDPARFPRGSATPDSAFLMADMATAWRPRGALVASSVGTTSSSPAGSVSSPEVASG